MAKKNYNLLIGVGALVGVVLLIALVGYLVSKPRPRVIQGEAEATEYRISCMVPGHVTELYCREGQQVHKGDTVAFIDSPQVRAKLAQAQAARSAAQAQSAKARNGARKEQIAGAYELWQQALVQEDVMKKSFERVKTLYDQKVISAQKYDETKAQYDAAVAQAKAAKSQYGGRPGPSGRRRHPGGGFLSAGTLSRLPGGRYHFQRLSQAGRTGGPGLSGRDRDGPFRHLVHLQYPGR